MTNPTPPNGTGTQDLKNGYVRLPSKISLAVAAVLFSVAVTAVVWAKSTQEAVSNFDKVSREVQTIKVVVCMLCEKPACRALCETQDKLHQ